MAEQSFNTDPHAASPTLEQQAAALDAKAAERASEDDKGSRPDWLPEQFKTVEDFAKSYNDGRAELTRAQQELAELKKGKEPATADTTKAPEGEKKPEGEKTHEEAPKPKADGEVAEDAAQKAVAAAGMDVSAFTSEFNETGDVSEEGRAKIAEGLKGQFGDQARALVDQYIEGSKATVANARTAAFNEAGGEENYAAMVDWAAKGGMKPAEVAAYNTAVDGDLNSRLLAIRGLKASFEAANGKPPALVKGDNAVAAPDLSPFRSPEEMRKAMSDPRYAKDPAYRNDVIQRTLRSNF